MKQAKPVDAWPSGEAWTSAILNRSPEDLAREFGISFESGRDDLDSYSLAAIESPRVGQFWLLRHLHAPMRGTEVLVDRATSRDASLAAVKAELGLGREAFEWVSSATDAPERTATATSRPIHARTAPKSIARRPPRAV